MDTDLLPTTTNVSFFQETGYWIAPKIISDDRLERLRDRMMRIYEGEFDTGRPPQGRYNYPPEDGNRLRKTDNVHWADSVMRHLATDPNIGAIAAKLMGASCIRLWHDQMLYKPGQSGSGETANVGWHQDYSYWQCAAEPTLLTAWVAFDDVDLNNGCMQVIPGSNHWGLVRHGGFFDQDIEKQEHELAAEGQRRSPRLPSS